uniref:hypothetical protein n=1 Tax=Propionibacterium freudenreichii TaxID=1744 RepID=UPI003857350E
LLAVTADARNPDDFALSNRQVNTRERFDISIVGGLDPACAQNWVAQVDRFPVYFEQDFATDHHLREVRPGD